MAPRLLRRDQSLDRAGDFTSRRAARPGTEQRIDHDALASARLLRHHALRERALGLRVLGLGGYDLVDGHANTGGGQRAREDPSIAAVVARAGKHDDAVVEQVRQTPHDLGRSRRTRALHQRARGNSCLGGGVVERGGIRGAQHAHRARHVPISAAAYPTTRSCFPVTSPECAYPTTSARVKPARRATSRAHATGTRPHMEM